MTDTETIDLTKLDGQNYSLWKFGVELVLYAKDLIDYVNGTSTEPNKTDKPAEWKIWKKNCSQASVILLGLVDKSLHASLINCDSPKAIWDKLESLYGAKNENAKVDAWTQFLKFRIKDGEPIAIQSKHFVNILKKLEDAGERPSEPAIVAKISDSLPSKFSNFRIAWKSTPENDRRWEIIKINS